MATEAVNELNEIITLCLDGKYGYEQAAEHVSDPSLKTMFTQSAAQRASFAGELQSAVRAMGGEPTDDGSVTAAFHRGWIGLKDAIAGGDGPVVAECIRGEEHAVKKYQSTLSDDDVPATAKELLSRQHGEIEQALSKLNQRKA